MGKQLKKSFVAGGYRILAKFFQPIIKSELKNNDGSNELKSQFRFLGDYTGFMAPLIWNFKMAEIGA